MLAALRDAGSISRAELARRTSLAPSTITGLVQGLEAENLIFDAGPSTDPQTRTGPKSRTLSINPALVTAVGVDFGFRTVRVLISDLAGRPLAIDSGQLPDGYDAPTGLATAAAVLDRVLGESGIARDSLLVAGVALPGPIDTVEQHVIESSILPGWGGYGAAEIGAAIGLPVVLENDANLAALGEHQYGAGRSVRNSLTVKFHSGVGAGLIVNGRLVSGARGGAGEIGHVEVDPRGPLCRCGKRGCLDTYAAVPSILSAMRPQHDIQTVLRLMELLNAGDAGADRVVRDAAEVVGRVVATASLLIAPELIVVVGAMSRAGDAVLDPIRDSLERQAIPDTHGAPPVVRGELGDRHTAMGAVALGLSSVGWLPED